MMIYFFLFIYFLLYVLLLHFDSSMILKVLGSLLSYTQKLKMRYVLLISVAFYFYRVFRLHVAFGGRIIPSKSFKLIFGVFKCYPVLTFDTAYGIHLGNFLILI